ncbi:hypothetical protein ACHAWF_011884 [Thalassiosira exigua]
MVIATDKNLGPAIIERATYIRRAWEDHLSDDLTYELIPPHRLNSVKADLRYKIAAFYSKMNKASLPDEEKEFFHRLKNNCKDRLTSKFYLTAKVHKTPWKTRPVVATCGTIFHGIGVWADYHLQRLNPLVPSHVKNGFALKEILEALVQLPEGTRMFTMDATAMYTNIETDHGLEMIEKFFELFEDQLPDGFPKELILLALRLIMKNNVFELGTSYFKQLNGTAMGTPPACMYATIYYAVHEILRLLKNYEKHLLDYVRWIDDGFILWNDRDDPLAYYRFCKDVDDFGILRWTVEERSKEVNFLDLTIKINDSNRIETRTYQKPMNLYLYLHHASAHPPGVLKGMIYGEVRRYYLQTQGAWTISRWSFYSSSDCERGGTSPLLRKIILDAANRLELPELEMQQQDDGVKSRDRLFLHMQYHPHGVLRHDLCSAFNVACDNFCGIVAFSRPPNLKDRLTSARLHEVAGQELAMFRL